MSQFEQDGVIYEDLGNGQVKVIGYAGAPQSGPQSMTIGTARPDPTAPYKGPKAETDLTNAQYQQPNTIFNQKDKLRSDYNALPAVKTYRVAIQQLAQALGTGAGSQSDLALTYAFAKAMDPESVVRESEQGMVAGSQPWFQAAVENAKKQFGMDGAGSFTPEARKALRAQIINSVKTRVKGYNQAREQFAEIAKRSNFDPVEIVGKHDADPFVPQFKAYDAQFNKESGPSDSGNLESDVVDGGAAGDLQTFEVIGPDGRRTTFTAPKNASDDEVRRIGIQATSDPAISRSEIQRGDYADSYLGQGLSGVNEGIASTLGAPVDLVTAGINLIPQGINALANTNIPTIQNPTLGSEQIKGWMRGGGMTFDETNDPSKQFVRRAGQSVGAAAVPLMGQGASFTRLGQQMLLGAGGGTGAATAQQLFPGNKMAEIAGEIIGGGTSAVGLLGSAKRRATRQIEAAVPTVPQLKEQAGELYRQAETRGVVAGPSQTQQLRDNFEQTLRNEGQLGPNGRISDADTNTTKAFNLIDQYAGGQMRPVEMDTVRRVISDGRKSADPSDQRLSGLLTEQFDDWARPLAPEFDQARDVSSRYLQAQDLEEARQLAEAGASQFGQSGLENAIRTQYRGLDRADIRGKSYFQPDVTEAIQRVSRGTTGSNLARNIGRFAPTGPVSFAAGVGVPGLAGSAMAGPLGGAIGSSVGLAGIGGRIVSNQMTNRAADIAELTARNGGILPQADIMTPEMLQTLTATTTAEAAKYVPPKARRRGLFGSRRP